MLLLGKLFSLLAVLRITAKLRWNEMRKHEKVGGEFPHHHCLRNSWGFNCVSPDCTTPVLVGQTSPPGIFTSILPVWIQESHLLFHMVALDSRAELPLLYTWEKYMRGVVLDQTMHNPSTRFMQSTAWTPIVDVYGNRISSYIFREASTGRWRKKLSTFQIHHSCKVFSMHR